MTEIEKTEPEAEAVAAYERGISSAEVTQAVMGRFLPTSTALTVGMLAVVFGFPLSEFIWLPVLVGPMVAGFWGGLRLLRRHLYPDADVSGRRSVVAGLLAPMMLFFLEITLPWMGPLTGMVMNGLVGIVLALAMFFAWLTPTPEELRPPGWMKAEEPGAETSRRPLERCLIVLRRPLVPPLPRPSRRAAKSLELASGTS